MQNERVHSKQQSSQPSVSSQHNLRSSKIMLMVLVSLLIIDMFVIVYQKYKENQPSLHIQSVVPKSTTLPLAKVDISVTQGWERYVDYNEQYSFQYPADWFIRTGNPNQIYNYDPDTAPGREFDPESDKDKIKIEIYTTEESYLEGVDEYIEKYPPTSRYGKPLRLQYQTISIDNHNGLKTLDDNSGIEILAIYLKNPLTNKFHTLYAMPAYISNREIVDQIISTFRFLDSEVEE